ncbi:MAG: class I SAM-dependent methyltransferase [bacterium]|nr:class I SAM-dependent methyltransferase [bacterium]
MTILYSELAEIYHEMYQKLFDYRKEFEFYNEHLKKFECVSVLEIGCGTGALGKYLIDAGYDYTGLDLYREMIDIARRENSSENFIQGDMRNLKLDRKYDSVIITGRSFSYLTEDREVNDTFKGIHGILNDCGILIFDNFDAHTVFNDFNEHTEQKIELDDKTITRINRSSRTSDTSRTWDWDATYIIEKCGKRQEYRDKTTLRAFNQDELRQCLNQNNFRIQEVIKDKTLIIIAEKL